MKIASLLARLRRDERGLALAEFALSLPLLMLVLAVTIEGGRMFYSYQAAIQGVRDASRYVGRVVPSDLCSSGGSIDSFVTGEDLEGRLSAQANAAGAFPPAITITDVVLDSRCEGVAGDYRVSPAPIAIVTATLRIEFPFSGVMRFATGNPAGAITTQITDEARIFGS
ncbi:TadE/TadG family type IV pilus assembly protein [Jannaschia seohaensis]|uniref:TadE-like protein n=1 Tax=Jannaschia seohaensis TaxID=475081 RepID=A0A2Y9AIN4_9RHOB|nr:TadE/TadG family type IV pilus assembly protein [Jannaschia seohaensis]PWJ20305.1 TadE-like protein [Jannaschia seohaensis]SSA44334.1 TadE-like protein [Jannaschia seohaensis]